MIWFVVFAYRATCMRRRRWERYKSEHRSLKTKRERMTYLSYDIPKAELFRAERQEMPAWPMYDHQLDAADWAADNPGHRDIQSLPIWMTVASFAKPDDLGWYGAQHLDWRCFDEKITKKLRLYFTEVNEEGLRHSLSEPLSSMRNGLAAVVTRYHSLILVDST